MSKMDSSKWTRALTCYDILGVPTGASLEHIKSSYRLLSKKTPLTDAAYQALVDPGKRREYDAWLTNQPPQPQEEKDWGVRGREKCSCGRILNLDEDWYCSECCGKLDYYVVFDMFGGHIIHDEQMPIVTDPDGNSYWQVPFGSLFGPFTKEEAEEVLQEKDRLREVGTARRKH